jgi:hypothetical protein
MATREQRLADYCLNLSNWAVAETARLWRELREDDIRGTWLGIRESLIEIHRAEVVQALKAVDDYMQAVAADYGCRYDVEWTDDLRDRPERVYWGESSTRAINRTPLIVLARIKDGQSFDEARIAGLNYLVGIMGTEPHQVQRTVMLERMLRQ